MDYTPESTEIFNQQQAPQYGMLKTLTLLTFIGCALAYIGVLYSIYDWKNHDKKVAEMEKMRDLADNEIIEKATEATIIIEQKTYENRYLLTAVNAVAISLCLIGAMRMRKLRKSGYPLYLIGELAPIIITTVIIGFSLVSGIMAALSGLVAIVFVILYTTQRKYLIYS